MKSVLVKASEMVTYQDVNYLSGQTASFPDDVADEMVKSGKAVEVVVTVKTKEKTKETLGGDK